MNKKIDKIKSKKKKTGGLKSGSALYSGNTDNMLCEQRIRIDNMEVDFNREVPTDPKKKYRLVLEEEKKKSEP